MELAANIRGLLTAQMAYHAAFDKYVEAAPWPRPKELLTAEAVTWPKGSQFDTLGWSPDGKVLGSYSLVVAADGAVLVNGWVDADGDGVPAHLVGRISRDGQQSIQPMTGQNVF